MPVEMAVETTYEAPAVTAVTKVVAPPTGLSSIANLTPQWADDEDQS